MGWDARSDILVCCQSVGESTACGPVKSFKRLITPAGKPQGFGFAEFEDPDGALRAMQLLNQVELPALEEGCQSKKLLVKADEKTKIFLDAYAAQRMSTNIDEEALANAKASVTKLLTDLSHNSKNAPPVNPAEKYVIPPHLHDLQEADLPETQRGLVINEIAQFRERAAKREREKTNDMKAKNIAFGSTMGVGPIPGQGGVPSGPKVREWGKPQGTPSGPGGSRGALGRDSQQGYQKPVGFVKSQSAEADAIDDMILAGKAAKTDEELEAERKEARRKDEENSFRDRERRYEPRERARIQALERSIAREKAAKDAQARDAVEFKKRLGEWDDDESDEHFYTDRARWRAQRLRRLAMEEAADAESRAFEEKEADNLRKESEAFLAKQMDEMQALAEEQRKAGMLLDDGAPVKLNVSVAPKADGAAEKPTATKTAVFGNEEEEEDAVRRRKVPLVKLDFSAASDSAAAKERLEKIKLSVPNDKETLFKAKIRWDGVTENMLDRKFEPLVKKLMIKYLGELEDDDLVMFVLEHLKDHKAPHKLVEGLEPVLEEEAVELTISVWRQVIFESMAYGEGLHTDKMLVE